MRTLAKAARKAPWQAEAAEPITVAARPMQGGLGRLNRLRTAIEILNPMDRALLLEWLDEISRPMSAREIEDALLATGLPRGDRRRLVLALKRHPVILIGRPQ